MLRHALLGASQLDLLRRFSLTPQTCIANRATDHDFAAVTRTRWTMKVEHFRTTRGVLNTALTCGGSRERAAGRLRDGAPPALARPDGAAGK
jgi:hypothetical protein